VNLLEIALPEIVSTGQQRDGLAGPETLIEVAKNSEVERIVKKLIVFDLAGTLAESKSSLDPEMSNRSPAATPVATPRSMKSGFQARIIFPAPTQRDKTAAAHKRLPYALLDRK
jgi:hypothetical protein